MSLALRISVGTNIALLAVAGFLIVGEPAKAPAGIEPAIRERSEAESLIKPVESAPAVPVDAPTKDGASPLTPAAVARFERQGVPRSFLVEVLLQDFARRWDQRVVELERQYAPKPAPEREYLLLARRREAERIRELKTALGEEGYLAWDKAETLRHFNTIAMPLEPAEADEAYRLQKRFDDKVRELQMAMEDGVADQADVAALQAQANDTFEKDVEKLLGRERYQKLRGLTTPVEAAQQREEDSTYRALQQYAGAWELAESEIQPVYETLKTFKERAERVRETAQANEAAGEVVDWKAIEASIEQDRQKTEAGLLGILGGERLRRLKQNGLLNPR